MLCGRIKMQHTDAVRLIRRTFENAYDETNLRTLVAELFHGAENKDKVYSGEYIPKAYRDHISSYKYICKYVTPDQEELAVLAVNCCKIETLERARTLQRNFIANYMKERGKDACLVAFYSDEDRSHWRFSFVRIDNSFNFETLKSQNILTPAKRYSYMVGIKEASHTAQQQLCVLLDGSSHKPTLSEIETAFAIEKISDQFFQDYKLKFIELVEYMEILRKEDKNLDNHFELLKISNELFCKKLLGQIVFLYFLQRKGWLGVPLNKNWGDGDKAFLTNLFLLADATNKNYFNDYLEPFFYDALATERQEHVYKPLECKIPFLNGGLFDPVGSYDWKKTIINIPNRIFRNGNDGILDVFDRYNFTVREDEPLEKEVAIDPEMLGKVFENLLEIKDRKSKGAFYTPREIVHYMCQESLIQYLSTRFANKIPSSAIGFFIKYGDLYSELENSRERVKAHQDKLPAEFDFIKPYASELDNALQEVKICDPAIGSGAFPVGMMHEIIRARQTLQNAGFIARTKKRSIYEYKRQVIQNSIYGVDIEQSAVDIAKLRLWLSLIVDEEAFDEVRPLPNLDYKIMCGNSLIGLKEDEIKREDLLTSIANKQEEFFNTSSKNKKEKIIKEISNTLSIVTGNKDTFDYRIQFSKIFKDNGGFDIIIGNPPYFKYEGEHKDEIPTLKQQDYFKWCGSGKINAYRVFLAMAFKRLAKKQATVCMIFQNSFLGDSSVAGLREYVLKNHQIVKIDSFPERDNVFKRVFSNVKMSVCILLANSDNPTQEFFLNVYEDRFFNLKFANKITYQNVITLDERNYTIPMLTSEEMPLLLKIYNIPNARKVKAIEGEINMTFHKHLLSENQIGPEVLKGAAIQRYFITEHMSQGKREFINVEQYERENSGAKTMHNKLPRIAMQGMTGVDDKRRLVMTYVPKGYYLANSCNYVLCEDEDDIRYVLAILNSKLLNWVFKKTSTNSNVNCYEIAALPIPTPEAETKHEIIRLVEQIEISRNNDSRIKTDILEQNIDNLVYGLFNLTSEEIEIVERTK